MNNPNTALSSAAKSQNKKALAPCPTVTNPYLVAATSDNTRRAYQADIRHFEQWGGRLPAKTEIILDYLQAFAETLNPRTLARRLTALKH